MIDKKVVTLVESIYPPARRSFNLHTLLLSNDLDKPHLNQLLDIQIHVRNFTSRITPQPQECRERYLPARPFHIPPTSHLPNPHLFFTDDVDDLVLIRRVQGGKGLTNILLFAIVCKFSGDVEGRGRGVVGRGGWFFGCGVGLGQGSRCGRQAAFVDDEVTDVFVDEETEVTGDDLVRVAVSDCDTIKVLQCTLGTSARETSAHAETVFRRYRRDQERSDMEEYDDSGGSLKLLQKVDEDRRSTIRTAGFIEEDANATESADWRTTHTRRQAQYGGFTIFLRILR